MMDKGRATFKAAGDLSQTNSLNDIQYPTDVFEMTGWIPLDNIVFIDLSDNKRTKELNWIFCFAIRKQIKKKNSTDHEKLDEIHLTNLKSDTWKSLHSQNFVGDNR